MESSRKMKCQRCNSSFECRAENIATCDCQKVTITEDVQQLISAHFNDCLCASCLLQLQNKMALRKTNEKA